MRAIDLRLRPAIPEFVAHLEWRLRHHPQPPTGPVSAALARALPPEQLIPAMDDAGIEVGVFTGRDWYGEDAAWPLTNEAIARTVDLFPQRLVGFGGVDPRRPDPGLHIRTAVEDLGLRGLCIDGFALGTNPADGRFDPVYTTCQELGVPIVITLGALPGVPVPMESSRPHHVDLVAARYPELRILLSHAGWPYTQEVLGVAFRHPNVWLENSFYHFAPGVPAAMVDAANGWLPERIMYASAFPSAPLAETLQQVAALPFTDEARDRVLYANAAAFLRL